MTCGSDRAQATTTSWIRSQRPPMGPTRNGQSAGHPASDRLREEHRADHSGDAVRRREQAQARPGRDAGLATVCREARRGPGRPGRSPERRRPPAARPSGGRQAADRVHHDRSAAGRAVHLERGPVRVARDHRARRRPGGRDDRPEGPRRDAPGAGADRGPLRRLRRPPGVRRHPAARPARHRRLPVRRLRPDRRHLLALRVDAGPAADAGPSPADRAVRGHRGHPRQPVHLRAERRPRSSSSSCRATSRPASTRRSSRRRRARSRAGWSR